MEKCKYCGLEFHPMMRWTKDNELIFVCQYTFQYGDDDEFTGLEAGNDCEKKAIADGYTKRMDLTPSR